ncbi:helix-turn-helix transcriptional regulator [Amycolatopsis sp. NPDC021455]|uniref:helix-turn-helix transcriptional regulator n=1 Tax=Amycolatopsis sp. NPDC021455 TaxID=3154901 RepID=UPI0033EBC06A
MPESRFPRHPFPGAVDDFPPGACAAVDCFRQSAWAWFDGRLDAALGYAAAAAGAGCAGTHEPCELAPHWYVALLSKAREFEAAWRAYGRLRPRRTTAESPRAAAASRIVRGELLCAMGRADDGLAEVAAGARIAERAGVRALLPAAYVIVALGALRRADMRVCRHFVDKLTTEALLGYFGQAAGAWVTALAAEARGGVAGAAGLITGIVTNPVALRQLLVSEPAAASWLVRATGKLGERDLAGVVVATAAEVSAKHARFPVTRAAALHAAGIREGDFPRLSEASNLYPDRWCGASALEDMAGVLAARRSERANAIRVLESALDTYTAVGANRDAARVVNKLRDFGVRRGVARAGECEGNLPHGLTGTEFAVAELVSRGHTNDEVGRQLFISRHTVAFHLKKVYRKMNVTSRVELAVNWNTARPEGVRT